MSRRALLPLGAIVLVAAILRLAGLASLPPGLHPDEAANAYEAWCLSRTGLSSDGRALPLVFAHHGVDWVEGVYVWLEVPFVALAGDRIELAARLPAALAGTAAVLAAFALGRRLGGARVGLLAAALLAVEPWAVQHSRFGERAALEPLLVGVGLALGLAGLEDDDLPRALLGGAVLGLATATYAPARLVVPLLAGALVRLAPGAPSRRTRLAVLLPVGLAFVAVLPFALSERGLLRLRAIQVATPAGALASYAVHFTPRTLFSGETGQGFAAKGVPPLLPFEGALVLAGLVVAARTPRLRFLLAWLLAFPLAAGLTHPSPNLLRAVFGLPLFAVVGAVGLDAWLTRLERKPPLVRRAVLAGSLALVGATVGFAAFRYVTVFPAATSAWAPYAGERQRVEAMRGRVRLTRQNEKALVDLYARERRRRWLSETEVVLD